MRLVPKPFFCIKREGNNWRIFLANNFEYWRYSNRNLVQSYDLTVSLVYIGIILDFKIIHVKEVKNSQGIEKEGFIRLLNDIQQQTEIRAVSTDRHNQIRKVMRCV